MKMLCVKLMKHIHSLWQNTLLYKQRNEGKLPIDSKPTLLCLIYEPLLILKDHSSIYKISLHFLLEYKIKMKNYLWNELSFLIKISYEFFIMSSTKWEESM